jgi:hypothetical protein
VLGWLIQLGYGTEYKAAPALAEIDALVQQPTALSS